MKNSIFSFIAIATIASALSAQASNYPITPNEVAGVTNLGPGVNTSESEYTPFITPDERFLFFQSNRSPSAGPEGDFDLWYSMNKPKPGSTEPNFELSANVGLPINSENLDGHPSLRRLPTGEYEMYFCSFSSPTRQGPKLTNIYYTIWKGGKWANPVPVSEINTDFHDRMPSISQDGKYLFFSSDRLGGHGGDDIWYSERDTATGKWGEPVNAGSINTAASEVTPAIHADGITLYFSSNQAGGVGGYDIYFTQSLAKLADENETNMAAKGWAQPLNLGKPFNSEFDDEYPTVIATGERVYFTSNRPEGIGAFDVYRAIVPEFARPTKHLSFQGRTFAGTRKRAIPAKVKFSADPVEYRAETTAEKNGEYKIGVVNQRIYTVDVEATVPGYLVTKDTLDTKKLYQNGDITRDYELHRDIKIPKKIDFVMHFVDGDGKAVNPKVKYRINPKSKKLSTLKIKQGRAQVQLFDAAEYTNEADAVSALDGLIVEVTARKKDFPNLNQKTEISGLLDAAGKEVGETLEVTYVMGTKSAEVKTEPQDEPKEEIEVVKPQKAARTLKFLGRIYFATDVHDKMVGDDTAFLKRVAKKVKHEKTTLIIYGHGDSRGTSPYNAHLSKLRAEFVKKKLVEFGAPAKRIVVKGLGKRRRRYNNDNTEFKKQKNRRADIFIYVRTPVAKE
ncbi:MAG: OmpA family protein [Spirochaetes bacterium]|nr:OmpA family protein [Spirochaetota bacterium]